MLDHRDSKPEERRLPDDLAHRILARAIELESDEALGTSVSQLRLLAQEAGIPKESFEAALREAELGRLSTETVKPSSRLARLWDRFKHRANQEARRSDLLSLNVAALLLSWVLMFALTRFVVREGWQAMELMILGSTAIGAVIARALRARLAALGLLGLAAFQAAEFAMHSLYGIGAVQGGPTHWAVMIAGVLGALLGARFERSSGAATALETPRAAKTRAPAPEADALTRESSFLRPSLHVT